MFSALGERLRVAFAPPRYLAFPFSGIDISASSVKGVRLVDSASGLILKEYAEVKLPHGAFVDGAIVNRAAVSSAIADVSRTAGIAAAVVSLPESKSFLFETTVAGARMSDWRIAVEQKLDELVPLPPSETSFDLVEVGRNKDGETLLAGIGFSRRAIDDVLSIFDELHISVRALEGETFAMARSLLSLGDDSTALLIDIGKTATKLTIVAGRIPRFAATIGIGGHALTLAVQKHFGVTEAEARVVKAERGIVPMPGNEDYLDAMLSTVSAIRDEIATRLTYWQEKAAAKGEHRPVSHAILAGGNSSLRGLPEYLEGAMRIPVVSGDVFANLASRETWIPPIEYMESLAYATPIGLALYDWNA